MKLELVYRDEHMVAINKPHGLLVHRSKLAADASEFAVQLLRDQLGQRVTPVHRLDRKTAGVLLFALNDDVNRKLNAMFDHGEVHKTYLALVRGYTDKEATVNYPLRKENGQLQEAITRYQSLEYTEVSIPLGKHSTQRYTLVEVNPLTGRMHQIRKHFNHLRHPIIGDRPHGCNKQNRLFKEKWNMNTMLLHASKIQLQHPVSGKNLVIEAAMHDEFLRTLKLLLFSFGQ